MAFEFGVQGWTYGEPRPFSITFYLDNTATVCDQYGRPIRRAVTSAGEFNFADSPPEANRDGIINPRPQFATHVQTIAALTAERVNWLAYVVRYITSNNNPKTVPGLSLPDAVKMQGKLIQEGNKNVVIAREIVCSGWPQLPYEQLKELPELPPTPLEALQSIRDQKLRKDALRIRSEMDTARQKELQATE